MSLKYDPDQETDRLERVKERTASSQSTYSVGIDSFDESIDELQVRYEKKRVFSIDELFSRYPPVRK